MDDETAAEFRRMELALLNPAVRRDRDRVAALLHEDFREFGSSGRVWNRDTVLDLLASEEYTAPDVEDFACHVIGPDVVLVTYRTSLRTEHEQRATLRSSLWIKDNGNAGGWKMRFHQGTRAEIPGQLSAGSSTSHAG